MLASPVRHAAALAGHFPTPASRNPGLTDVPEKDTLRRVPNERIMFTNIAASTRRAGFWSAVLATVFNLVYIVGQLAEWLG